MKRVKFITSKEYLVSEIQLALLDLIGNYKDSKNLKDYELAKELGVSKGYVSQILHATYDHKISKVVDLALACNCVPLINFVDLDEYVKNDMNDKVYKLIVAKRPKNVTHQTASNSKVAKTRQKNNKRSRPRSKS